MSVKLFGDIEQMHILLYFIEKRDRGNTHTETHTHTESKVAQALILVKLSPNKEHCKQRSINILKLEIGCR